MVIERAELTIVPGREGEFEAAMDSGIQLLSGAENCRSVTLGRCIENPSKFMLLLEWDSIDAHWAFTKTEAFAEFRELAGPFFAGRPSTEHFEPRITS